MSLLDQEARTESMLATIDQFSVDQWGITFTVYGKAEPGGSKRPGIGKNNRMFVRDDNPKTKVVVAYDGGSENHPEAM